MTNVKPETLTEIVMILDKSGSMSGLETDTIGGYNAFLEKQKTANGKAIVSTVLFNDGVTVLYDRLPLEQVPAMTEKDYSVDGCTALLDAMGETIHRIRKVQKNLPEEQHPDKTVFVITTDGLENASRTYTYDKVKRMVEKRKEKNGWEFLFLGANIDAIEVAGQVGIAKDRAVNFVNDAKGTSLNYSSLSKAVCEMRAMPGAALPEDWKADIEEDFKKRSKSR